MQLRFQSPDLILKGELGAKKIDPYGIQRCSDVIHMNGSFPTLRPFDVAHQKAC